MTDVDPLSVACPRCGVIAGDTCPGRNSCASRCTLARVEATRTAAAAERIERNQRGLAKVREAMAAATGHTRAPFGMRP